MTTRIQGLQRHRLFMLAFSATLTVQAIHKPIAYAESPVAPIAKTQNTEPAWTKALRATVQGGRPSLILVTSNSLPHSREWAGAVHQQIAVQAQDRIACVELLAETAPDQVKALRVRTLPSALFYQNDGRGGLKLVGFREGAVEPAEIAKWIVSERVQGSSSAIDHASFPATKRVVKIQRASSSNPVEQVEPSKASSRDEQVSATTHQNYAQASAQGSPQTYTAEPPNKQFPPSPLKMSPPQQSPPVQAPPPQQSPPAGYGAPPPAQPQPVYAYVPQQPVYSAPPSAPPITVQPPAGQVVVQPAPLNVVFAPSPPPQVTYMAPAMGMAQPQPIYAPANAFTAAPPAYSPPVSQPPFAAAPPPPQPTYAAQPPAYGAPQPASGGGSSSMLMTISPNLFDRFLGGLGRVLAERGNPRLRMSMESPAYFAAPQGVSNPVSPLQAYMAVPNGGGGDATEAYVKAYIALCKEKGVTPNLPGLEPPPVPNQPSTTSPMPSPQDTQNRKKGWFH